MKTTRSLSLKRETFTELTVDDLGGVGGGAVPAPSRWTCPVLDCINSRYIPCTV